MRGTLLQPLFEGPVDIVGDVHGEIEALHALLGHLGYGDDGRHPEARRLVFVGDLTDRGPDSLSVVQWVRDLVDAGRAQCVLGNHDLNILLDHPKSENRWFYGQVFRAPEGPVVPQQLADARRREEILRFFDRLPLALARDDLRVVHAGWQDAMIDAVSRETDARALFERHREKIDSELSRREDLDCVDRALAHQNRNPVKWITSGPEERSDTPVERGGKVRYERRVSWWEDYNEDAFCVFGHYSIPHGAAHGTERTFCVDYNVGKRWQERREPAFDGTFRRTRLAALRFPEKEVVFDDGGRDTRPR